MYLSQITVDVKDALNRGLFDNHAWHRAMWKAFPSKSSKKRKFLIRVDRKQDRFEILLLSERAPVPTDLGRWKTKQIPSSFLRHERYLFALRANPTVKRVIRDDAGNRKKNGRRTAIISQEELAVWMRRKAESAGFEIQQLSISPPVKEPFYYKGRKGMHARVEFSGILNVSDREAFIKAFKTGIGPAKAFGFGMLTLRTIAAS